MAVIALAERASSNPYYFYYAFRILAKRRLEYNRNVQVQYLLAANGQPHV